MKQLTLIATFVAALCIGCGSPDPGNVAAAQKGAERAPKSAADLPANMPKDARASAAAAIGQAQAAQQQNSDPARVHALEMMRQQHHH